MPHVTRPTVVALNRAIQIRGLQRGERQAVREAMPLRVKELAGDTLGWLA